LHQLAHDQVSQCRIASLSLLQVRPRGEVQHRPGTALPSARGAGETGTTMLPCLPSEQR